MSIVELDEETEHSFEGPGCEGTWIRGAGYYQFSADEETRVCISEGVAVTSTKGKDHIAEPPAGPGRGIGKRKRGEKRLRLSGGRPMAVLWGARLGSCLCCGLRACGYW